MKVTLIHNPGAGDGSQPTAGQLLALIEEAGHRVRYQSAKEKGWSKVLKKNADIVAVAGGDGTVGRVARRLVGRRLPLAVLPMGTANNISRTLGIAGATVTQLIPTWATARRMKFDAGCARGPWGSRYFIEGVGIGLFPRTLPAIRKSKTMANLIDAEAKVAYALQLLKEHVDKCPAMKLTATLDGKDLSGKYILFEAMNTRHIGPNLFLAPDVSHDNGLLDMVFVQEKDRKKLTKYLATWQEGKFWPMELGVGRGKRLKVEWTGFAVHIDDKFWPKKDKKKPQPPAPIELTIKRGAVEFLVPRKPLPGLGAKGQGQ
jgi:diacylglycerol kinase family enzyme